MSAESTAGEEEVREDEATPALHAACQESDADRVKELLAANAASIDQADKNGRTALYVACKHGQAACVELLIAAKAGVDCARSPVFLVLKRCFYF